MSRCKAPEILNKTEGRSCGKFYRKNDQKFYRGESAMADRWAFFSSLL